MAWLEHSARWVICQYFIWNPGCWMHDKRRSPARREAGMGRHPCTPGPGRCPWEPRFLDAGQTLLAYAAAARGGRAPGTLGPGRCPWEPQFDAAVYRRLAYMPMGRAEQQLMI